MARTVNDWRSAAERSGADRIGLVEHYPGAWHEPAMKFRRKRAGNLLIALPISIIILGVVLLVMESASAGVVPILVGVVGLVVNLLITRRNQAHEAPAE